MILVAIALAALLTVPLTGGRLSRLADVRLRHGWTVWASIAMQFAITVEGAHVPRAMAVVLHLSSYALAAWCLWANRRLPGVPIVSIGAVCNVLAIVANGGSMPATAWAWRTSGLDVVAAGRFSNSATSSGSPLWFLGDVFAVPRGLPFANVFSVGDVVIVIGLVVFAHLICRGPQSDDKIDRCVACIPILSSTSPLPTPTQ